MERKIRFVDAQKMKKEYPDTFYAPELDDLKAIKPGEIVKVCAYRERFWVTVTALDGDNITGQVNNHLCTRRLKFNDIITFKAHNVYNIWSIEEKGLERMKSEQAAKKKVESRRKGRGI